MTEGRRFDPAMVAELDEPVQRYFTHALSPGSPLSAGVRLTMAGRIKVGVWLPFTADWEGDGRSFIWRARAGWGPAKALHVVDRYADGSGSMNVRLFGSIPLVRADDADTVRSGAGRAALEAATWAPAALLPDRGIAWRAESDALIVASWDVPPERPEVRVNIDNAGAVRSASALRWDNGEHGPRGSSPAAARSKPSSALATSSSRAVSPSAGGLRHRAGRRSSRPTSSPPNRFHSAYPDGLRAVAFMGEQHSLASDEDDAAAHVEGSHD